MATRRRTWIAMLAAGFAQASAAATGGDAISAMAAQFEQHPLIMIGELHRSREIHAFLQQLLHDPRFICMADDIVVEFGNSRLQPVADAYVAGAPTSEAQLQALWRDTIVPLTWNSPVYRQVYESVRAVNRDHLCPHPLRIVLADSPLDWSKVDSGKDLAAIADRDASYADVVEREVLDRHHRALLVAGKLHALKRVPADIQGDSDPPTAAQIIERRHPGALFSIVAVPSPDAARALAMGVPPSFVVVKGSDVATANFQLTDYRSTFTLLSIKGHPLWSIAPDRHWPRIGDVVDGLLYLGGNHDVNPDPAIYLDPEYQRELRRRAAIIQAYNGQDFNSVIDGLVKQASAGKQP